VSDGQDTPYDVIVVGAGFAGATAARELATRGLRTLVLESRDRAGGRTGTTTLSNGDIVEVGGTYVHWFQPHVWSEITRYGLVEDVVADGEAPEAVLAPAPGGGLAWTEPDEHHARERRLLTAFFEGSEKIVPRPFQPGFAAAEVAAADPMSIADRLDAMDLDEPDRAFIEAFFGTHTGEPSERGSYLTEVRWWAPSGHHFPAMQETVWTYRLGHGMRRLVEAILADGASEVRYGAHVARIESGEGRATVSTLGGETFHGRAVVVATPSGVWPDIDFVPALGADRIAAAREGLQAPGGSKGYAVVRHVPRAVYVQPRAGHALGALWTSHRRTADEQVMVFFGTPLLKDATDLAEVGAAVRDLLPEAEVAEVVGRNYVQDDPTLRGGWPVMKPGQFGRYLPHERFLRPEDNVAFATADIATGWNGFVDGAVEAGIVAAGQIRRVLDGTA
jgi:monoamine oxidase